MLTQTYSGTLVVQSCVSCGMTFGVASDFDRRRREDHKSFYCPAGHPQIYTDKSEAEKLKQEVAQQNETISYLRTANTSLHSKITEKNYSIRALKAAKTRILNRVKHGVCPCCNRTFQNLQSHFKSVHPELFEKTELQ